MGGSHMENTTASLLMGGSHVQGERERGVRMVDRWVLNSAVCTWAK
jgi:hypothetical protein